LLVALHSLLTNSHALFIISQIIILFDHYMHL